MIELRPGDERGRGRFDWLESRFSFSFADYFDRERMGFRSLRVINEDWIAPGAGFPSHPHRDMEILSYVLEGTLEHRDSEGSTGRLRHGTAQLMSAGRGIVHSEYNGSQEEPLHLLQIWLLPSRQGLAPRYQEAPFTLEDDAWTWLATPPGSHSEETAEKGVLEIQADARVAAGRVASGGSLVLPTTPDRYAYLHCARGSVRASGHVLSAGDALLLHAEPALTLESDEGAELLRFDLD